MLLTRKLLPIGSVSASSSSVKLPLTTVGGAQEVSPQASSDITEFGWAPAIMQAIEHHRPNGYPAQQVQHGQNTLQHQQSIPELTMPLRRDASQHGFPEPDIAPVPDVRDANRQLPIACQVPHSNSGQGSRILPGLQLNPAPLPLPCQASAAVDQPHGPSAITRSLEDMVKSEPHKFVDINGRPTRFFVKVRCC